jgi:hypothetical protein
MNSLQWVSGLFVFSQVLFFIEFFLLKNSFAMKQVKWFKGEFLSVSLIYFLSLFGILFHPSWVFPVSFALVYIHLLFKWKGNFNGGSDNMTFVLLTGLFLAKFTRHEDTGLIYISILVMSSYVMAGWVKAKNPEWWSGESLIGFLQFSPLQKWNWQKVFMTQQRAFFISRATLFFELSFPLALLSPKLTVIYLFAGLIFHFSNWFFFRTQSFFLDMGILIPSLNLADFKKLKSSPVELN